MREYGKHALYEYARIALRRPFKWSAIVAKRKWLIVSTEGTIKPGTRSIYLMTYGIIGRSFKSRYRRGPARFTEGSRNKASLAWNHSLHSRSRDAQIVTGTRVIVIRDVSPAQDLSNQSRTSLRRRIPWPRCFSLSLSISPSFYLLSISVPCVVYSHPLERSRQLPREFDDTVIDYRGTR